MEQSAAFVAFIRSLKLRHFKAHELVEPPRQLWRNYVGVLTVADQAREELGFALSISKRGSYRDPVTNREAGGGKRSRHQLAEALDLKPAETHPPYIRAARVLQLHNLLDGWRKEGRIFALQTRLGRIPALDRAGRLIEDGTCWRWVYHGKARRQLPAAFRFRGGLGLYSSFVHVDTRGRNATWRGSTGTFGGRPTES